MNKERLKIALEHFKKQPEETIDMRWWSLTTIEQWRNPEIAVPNCHTTHCFVGHGACIQEFNKLGLQCINNQIYFNELEGFDAVEAFFDLTREESTFLFLSDSYGGGEHYSPTKQEVIDRIQLFIGD